jgi:hypothetical protein
MRILRGGPAVFFDALLYLGVRDGKYAIYELRERFVFGGRFGLHRANLITPFSDVSLVAVEWALGDTFSTGLCACIYPTMRELLPVPARTFDAPKAATLHMGHPSWLCEVHKPQNRQPEAELIHGQEYRLLLYGHDWDGK